MGSRRVFGYSRTHLTSDPRIQSSCNRGTTHHRIVLLVLQCLRWDRLQHTTEPPTTNPTKTINSSPNMSQIETTLALDQTIKRFRFQYEKFYRQLRGSMDREKRVLTQLADVKAQMVDNAQRLELALKARKHDESVIRTLRAELEAALQQANSSQSREAHAMSLVKQLRQEVHALTKYAHQTFTDNNRQQHAVAQPHAHPQHPQRSGTQDPATIELMPSFTEWKHANHIMHDHHRDQGNPDHLKSSVERRRHHLRSPLERATDRTHKHAPPIASRKNGMIRL